MLEQPCVYVLECSDKSLYVGSTTDLERRFWEHQTGYDPDAYTATRRPVSLVGSFPFPTYEQARQAEYKMKKKWSRAKKLAFIEGDQETFLFASRKPKERRRLLNKATQNQ